MKKVLLLLMTVVSFNLSADISANEFRQDCLKVKISHNDCLIFESLAFVESKFNPRAFNKELSGSYGLLQIQCSTARMHGLKGSCAQLFDPLINLRYANKHLTWIRSKTDKQYPSDLFSIWNAGFYMDKGIFLPRPCYAIKNEYVTYSSRRRDKTKRKCLPGEYLNHGYVIEVMRYYEYLLKKRNDYFLTNLVFGFGSLAAKNQ